MYQSRFSGLAKAFRAGRTLSEETQRTLRLTVSVLAAIGFVLACTAIVSLDSLLPSTQGTQLRIGDVAAQDIRAPVSITYVSDVLTEARRQAAIAGVSPVYDPPDPNVARQQIQLLRQILDYIDNVRRDPFGTLAQKETDISYITALTLSDDIIRIILQMDDERWRAVDTEASIVLERVMRESIRQSDIPVVTDTLPTQVSVRFDPDSAAVVVAIVSDLIRPNRLPNPAATEQARQTAAANVPSESRSFERGQIVIRAGARIDAADFEALERLGLLESPDFRAQRVMRSFLASILILIVTGMYFIRSQPEVFSRSSTMIMLAVIFLIMLFGARIFSADGQVYLYPAAALALMFVALTSVEVAFVSIASLALFIGLMLNNSLEVAVLVMAGGMSGALTLRRSERLNNYFFAGLVVAATNALVVTIFNIELLNAREGSSLTLVILYALLNGVISAMAALAGIYLLTYALNLPTSIKLVELSQPSQPLLQRLLREAPGTYQHSLQVANLCEQAANTIGANAELVRVAALYHDVGKIPNAAFFVENQVDGANPHDLLNDPYRSAAIIISHVPDGEKLARQYRLPARIRDFILEHHGTTLVSYFYTKAVNAAGDIDAVDPEPFTYPGPKPRSRETAIMMLADTCESTVRARKPANKQEIAEIVGEIFDRRMRDGQLDEATVTLRDLELTREIFVEMLQGVFHPRINYPTPLPKSSSQELQSEAPRPLPEAPRAAPSASPPQTERPREPAVNGGAQAQEIDAVPLRSQTPAAPIPAVTVTNPTVRSTLEAPAADDDSPLPDVPPLRRSRETRPETDKDKADSTGEERKA
jgi:putative nucleotidyltransferase with HDIG domain